MKRPAPRLREYLKGLPQGKKFSPAGAARATGIDREQVNNALPDFLRRGEIKRIGFGKYRFIGVEKLWAKEGEIRPRLFRAMYIKGTFTAGEIALLSDAERNYVHKVINRLAKSGEVEKTGQRTGHRGRFEGVYGVRDRNRFFLKHLAPPSKSQRG